MSVPVAINNLVSGSGNNFHAKVARWFRTNGWHVIVSPYYMDQTQSKAREIDLVVEKYWPVSDGFGKTAKQIGVRLFVECKFIPNRSNSVFWFTHKSLTQAKALVFKTGIFKENNGYADRHHYLAQGNKVAKLFASDGKGQEADPFYKALNQSLNAMVSLRGRGMSAAPLIRDRGPAGVLEYPIIVCSSFNTIYKVDFDDDQVPPSKMDERFQLEVSYAYIDRQAVQREEYFLLDVVEFETLSLLAAAIKTDADAAAYLLGY